MVGRGRDEADPGGGEAGLGDGRRHLVTGELAPLPGLGPLGDLDLDVVGVDQVLRGHPEAAGRHLLDGTPPQVAVAVRGEAVGVLAALAGVGLAAEPVHGDGQRLVGLGRDGSVGHRPGGEPGHDRVHRLHLVDGDRGPVAGAEVHQPPEGGQMGRLLVDGLRVLLEHLVPLGPGGVLELEHRLGVEQVDLTLAPPLVLAPDLPLAVGELGGTVEVGQAVPADHLVGQDVEPHPADARHRAGEVLVDDVGGQADGLEHLGAGVGRHRRDAHLGHDLDDALGGGLDVVLLGLARGHAGQDPRRDHVVDGLEGQVRVDGGRPEALEQGHVVDLAGVARLDHQAHLGPGLLPHQVVVDGGDQQQRRDRCQLGRRVPVGQHDDVGPLGDGRTDPAPHLVDGRSEGLAPTGHLEQSVDGERSVARGAAVLVDVEELGQVVVVDHRHGQDDLAARLGGGLEQIGLGPQGGEQGGDQLLPDGVERGVGHLGEQLGEVVVEQPGPLGEDGDGGVGAHRPDGLGPGLGHGLEDQAQLLVGVAEQSLAARPPTRAGG